MAARAVYAAVPLSYAGQPYRPGDRVDEDLPAEVVQWCVERGEAVTKKSDVPDQPTPAEPAAPVEPEPAE